jgi:RNA recognition motif-containing protein
MLEGDFADAWAGMAGYKSSRLRRSRGKLVGFVDFTDAEAARAALERMQGHKFANSSVPIRTRPAERSRAGPGSLPREAAKPRQHVRRD